MPSMSGERGARSPPCVTVVPGRARPIAVVAGVPSPSGSSPLPGGRPRPDLRFDLDSYPGAARIPARRATNLRFKFNFRVWGAETPRDRRRGAISPPLTPPAPRTPRRSSPRAQQRRFRVPRHTPHPASAPASLLPGLRRAGPVPRRCHRKSRPGTMRLPTSRWHLLGTKRAHSPRSAVCTSDEIAISPRERENPPRLGESGGMGAPAPINGSAAAHEEWRGGGNEPVENTGKKLRRKADGEPAAEAIRTRLPGPP